MIEAIIVDDEYYALEGIKNAYDFESNGIHIMLATTDPVLAKDTIIERNPDLVLTDIRMLDVNGLDMISNLRKLGYKGIFCIISGYGNFEYAKRAMELDINYYILKPIDKKELKKVMDDIRSRFADSMPSACNKVIESSSKTFREITAYINREYASEITLKSLSERFYVNPTYICDMFNKYKSTTFTKYLTIIRMRRAKVLLIDTSEAIKSIAIAVGYFDYSYFTKIFKQMYLKTPSQFRKENQK